MEQERFDVTARKFHQWVVVGLSAFAFILGGTAGGAIMVVVALVMLLGRFWDEADLFRLFYRGVLADRGVLRPRLVVEDRATRRVARVMGGAIQLAAGLLILTDVATPLAWALIGLIGIMVALDAALDFCILCFVVHRFQGAASHA